MSKHASLNLAEYVSIAASVAGTIGAAISKEIIFAAIPLTITLGLNAIDRHRFKKLNQQQIENLHNLIQQTQQSQNQTNASFNSSIDSFFLRQKEDRELTNRVHLQTQEQIEEFKKASIDSNRSINSLAQNFSKLDRLSQSINSQNERIDLLENREIDFELKLQELNLIKQEIRNYAQVKHLFEQRLDRLEKDSTNIPSPIQDLIQQTQSDRERIWARIKELERNNISFERSIDSLFSRQQEVQELTNQVQPEIQKQIDELEETCKNSIRSIDSLTKDFSQLKNLFSNSPLIIDVEELKKQIKQVNKILEYLNNTKAEKQELIDRIESINSLVKKFSNNVVEEVKPLDDRIKHDAEQEINDLGDRIKNAFEPLNNLF